MRATSAMRFPVALTAVFALAAVGSSTRAGLIPGGGSTASDCYVEFNVARVTGTSNVITCVDGDPACDSDDQCQNTCTFRIALCANESNVSGCTPKAFKKSAKVSRNLLPVPTVTGTSSACGAFTNVTVVMKVKKGKAKPKTLKITSKAVVTGGKPKSDKDKLVLKCMPRTGACPTTTTTTTTTSTTSTTLACVPEGTLGFTTVVGTSDCGGAGIGTAGAGPFSGELDSDAACTTKLTNCGPGTCTDTTACKFDPDCTGHGGGQTCNGRSAGCDLGLGCLFFGGGSATTVPPGNIPNAALSNLQLCGGGRLGPTTGDPASCTSGAGPGMHCANGSVGTGSGACTVDADCGNSCPGCAIPGSCTLDVNCFFGPMLPIPSPAPFGALTTCVMNVIQMDAGGTVNTATGASSVSLPLSSRVYITGNTASPCPKCLSSVCDATWKTNTGLPSPDSGSACTATGLAQTSISCRPALSQFQAPLAVDLTPLTSGTATRSSDSTGFFCPGQNNGGVFGRIDARCVKATGSPAGDLTDNMPHNSHLVSAFCIPGTGNGAVDGVADLPGPGAIGLNGSAQITP